MSFKKQFFLLLVICSSLISIHIYPMVILESIRSARFQNSINQKLKNIAITQGCGYKAANLTILQTITAEISRMAHAKGLSYTIDVPKFTRIPSDKIQNFIKTYTQIDIAQEWSNIITTFFSEKIDQDKTITNKQFPDGFLEQSQKLENK